MPVTSVCEQGEQFETADVECRAHRPTGKPSQKLNGLKEK